MDEVCQVEIDVESGFVGNVTSIVKDMSGQSGLWVKIDGRLKGEKVDEEDFVSRIDDVEREGVQGEVSVERTV